MSSRAFIALGTASQVPTRERNHNGYFIRWDDEGFLLDPGEGTQRQMTFAGVSASQITKIFITHFHGDHCLGLPGVLQRISLDKVAHAVELYYPAYGQKFIDNLRNASVYFNTANIVEKPFSAEGVIFKSAALKIKTRRLEHSVESWGYRFEEPDGVTMILEKLQAAGVGGRDVGRLKSSRSLEINGKTVRLADVSVLKKGLSLAFVMDTGICEAAYKLAKNADFLISEATYLSSETEDAGKNKHLTAAQAAEIARQSKAGKLILTHFSQRYTSIEDFIVEAKEIHHNSVAVKDGEMIVLSGKQDGGNRG